VTSITAQTRKALQQYIGDAFKRGVPPRLLAKQLRAIVGLTDKQAASIGRMRDEWLDEGLSDDVVERRVEFESAKALKVRTEMIARTETIAASNAGQRIAWQQARSEGLLSPDLVKVWITTPDDRTCSECEAIDGEQANIDSPFSIGVVEPPAHPNCRCAVGLERAGTWLPPEEEEA
jgi:SPP1 gp7 family putative phage head morphogenesis protein